MLIKISQTVPINTKSQFPGNRAVEQFDQLNQAWLKLETAPSPLCLIPALFQHWETALLS
jgi:hypothetical protein